MPTQTAAVVAAPEPAQAITGANAAQIASVIALIEAQSVAREQIRRAILALVSAQVRSFRGWRDQAQVTRFAQKLARITQAGQRRTATSTDVYGSRILTELLKTSVQPIGLVDTKLSRGGVPLESVYGRLADEYRYLTATRSAESPGRSLAAPGEHLPVLSQDQILERVVTRAETQTDTNLTIALREQWAAVTDASPSSVTGYRRIVHPEFAKVSGTCGLCVVASDQVYRRGDLLPIHDHCGCSVAPIIGEPWGEGDPGSAINQMDLSKLYGHAGDSTLGPDLRKTKYELVQHGELGPVLVFRGQHWRRPSEATKDIAKRTRDNPEATLAAAEKAATDLEARKAAGENVAGPLQFQRSLVTRMKNQLAAADSRA